MASIPLKSDDSLPPRRGIVFILSAPSGAGKTTLSRAALGEIAGLGFSISLTTRAPLDKAIASGRDILLDIDIQGARQIRAKYPHDAVSIFVLPPTLEELAGRLRGRATEDESEIQHRLNKAREEAEAYPEYDHLIINAEIPKSVPRLETIVNAERLKVSPLR